MDALKTPIDLFLHLDKHLADVIHLFGPWTTYALLFVIVFVETGVVIAPFLPGDSLLFAAGALAASTGVLGPVALFVLLASAAIAGDTVNYWIGAKVGPKVFHEERRFLNHEHLTRTQSFYEKHGAKTIVLARFVPIIRTFAPFVAGIGTMNYSRFLGYNVFGGVLWTGLFVFAGYFFGNIPVVKDNFGYVIVAIIVLSVLPGVWEYLRHRREGRRM